MERGEGAALLRCIALLPSPFSPLHSPFFLLLTPLSLIILHNAFYLFPFVGRIVFLNCSRGTSSVLYILL